MTTYERVEKFLNEIEKNNKKGNKINAILQVNPNALLEAKKIDEKIKKGKAGKLAGKVIAIKANINVKGLNISTDDCMSKPFELDDLCARIRAIEKRSAFCAKSIVANDYVNNNRLNF